MTTLTLSPLGHTWILDLDGIIVKHNGHKIDGYDTLLDGAAEFLCSIPDGDMIVIITSRTLDYKEQTERFLTEKHIRYNQIIFEAPYGERIVVNDRKPSGLNMAVAINLERNREVDLKVEVNENL